MSSVSEHEPDPIRNELPAIWEIIQKEMAERDAMGRIKHGGPLQPFNGRDNLWDAYQEALDLVAYLRTKIWEQEHPEQKQALQERIDAINKEIANGVSNSGLVLYAKIKGPYDE